MRDPSSSSPQPDPTPLWRIRHSPAASAAAMVLFVVVSALWLVAADTARPAVISQPGCLPGRACPQLPSYVSLHVWLLLGIAGAVLTLASFVLVARRAVGERREVGSARKVRLAVATVVAGAVAEVLVAYLVTHVAIVTAPLGFEYSGETAAPILILGVTHLAHVGALALVWGRLLRLSPGQPRPNARRIRSWTAVLGLGGMVLGCGAFAAWSLRAANDPFGGQHQAHRRPGMGHECRSMVARAVRSHGGSHARGGRMRARHDVDSRWQGPACAVYERPHRLSSQRTVTIRPPSPARSRRARGRVGPRSQAFRPARPAAARRRASSRPPAASCMRLTNFWWRSCRNRRQP